MSLINKLRIKFFADHVGKDEFGNEYFLGKNINHLGQKKRFVIYNGMEEGSKVPPMWHAWLHYLTDDVPTRIQNYDWQQAYVPNLTGTIHADCDVKKEVSYYSVWSPRN